MNMYKTSRWKRLRERILRRDKYQCQYLKRYGKNRDADTAHHIYPVSEYPEYAWEEWNLISLSNVAHDKMHDRITGRLTVEGEKLKALADKRRAEKQSPHPSKLSKY